MDSELDWTALLPSPLELYNEFPPTTLFSLFPKVIAYCPLELMVFPVISFPDPLTSTVPVISLSYTFTFVLICEIVTSPFNVESYTSMSCPFITVSPYTVLSYAVAPLFTVKIPSPFEAL